MFIPRFVLIIQSASAGKTPQVNIVNLLSSSFCECFWLCVGLPRGIFSSHFTDKQLHPAENRDHIALPVVKRPLSARFWCSPQPRRIWFEKMWSIHVPQHRHAVLWLLGTRHLQRLICQNCHQHIVDFHSECMIHSAHNRVTAECDLPIPPFAARALSTHPVE